MKRKKQRFGNFDPRKRLQKKINMSKIRCYECNEYRHFKRICPKLIFRVGLLREKLSLYYFTVSLQFLAKENQGFAVLFGILVVTCIDGVLLNVLLSVLCEPFPFFSFCTLNKRSVKVRIHYCHALLLSLFNFNVFYCLRGIQSIICSP